MVDDKGRKPEDNEDPDDEDLDDEPEDDKGNSLEEALTKANSQAKRWRLRATGKDPAWNAKQKTKTQDDSAKTTEGGNAADREALERDIRAKVEQEYAARADEGNLRAAVSTALAGMVALSDEQLASPAATRKAIQRVTNMIDLKSLHMDDDGEIEGLDEEIKDLRRSYPGLFKGGSAGGGKKVTRGGDGAARSSSRKVADDDGLSELAAAMFGGDD